MLLRGQRFPSAMHVLRGLQGLHLKMWLKILVGYLHCFLNVPGHKTIPLCCRGFLMMTIVLNNSYVEISFMCTSSESCVIPSEVWSSFCCVLDSWITPGLPQISLTGWQEHTHTLPCGAEKPGTHLASEVLQKPFSISRPSFHPLGWIQKDLTQWCLWSGWFSNSKFFWMCQLWMDTMMFCNACCSSVKHAWSCEWFIATVCGWHGHVQGSCTTRSCQYFAATVWWEEYRFGSRYARLPKSQRCTCYITSPGTWRYNYKKALLWFGTPKDGDARWMKTLSAESAA